MSMKGREELKEVLIILKSDGYSLKDGKKSTKTKELKVNDGNRWNHVYVDGISKKGNNIGVHPNSFNGNRFS